MSNSQNDIGNEAPAYGGTGMVDNCIVQSQVVAGNADFFSVAGLNLTLIANATDPFEVSVAGKRVKLTANVVLAVTDNAHNFIFIDQTGALSRTATPTTYSPTAPGAPAAGDMWFDLGKNLMKTWNGAAWVASTKVPIGYVRADAAAINAAYVCEPIGAYPWWKYQQSDGSDGFLDATGGATTINGTKSYTAIVIRDTATVTQQGQTFVQTLRFQGIMACVGTGGVDLNLKGRARGNGANGTGAAGGGNGLGGPGGGGGGGTNAGGAGGASNLEMATVAIGGTGGAAGGAGGGPGASGAQTNFSPNGFPVPAMFGGGNGGGGGGGTGAAAGANGGNGGGNGNYIGPAIRIGASAFMRADGEAGTVSPAAARGAGGGGGGGVIQTFCRNWFQSGTFSAALGLGGGNGGNAGAGAGGDGLPGVAQRFAI